MNSTDYDKLQEFINEVLNAHKLAKWELSFTRMTIAKVIVKKFKRYIDTLEKKNVNKV